jgi:hypothetical protein
MTDVPFPLLTAPGRTPQAAGGRLINCYPEQLPATAGKPYAYWRVPGLKLWGTTLQPNTNIFRGGLVVGNLLYAVIGTAVFTFPVGGGAGTQLTGAMPGTALVTMARNNRASPDIVIVSPGDGAFAITSGTSTVVSYSTLPGATAIGQPNAVVFHKSFFIFTYGDGHTQASDPNSLNINALNFATAESKPDPLYRPIPLGNGQLLLCGANSMEVWGGQNDTGFPFSYVSTIARGLVGISAIAGHEEGFGKGIFFVGDDNKVSTLTGYTPTPISVPDLDLLIEAEPDKTKISVAVYVSQGHGVVVVKGANWCWEYDTTLLTWHERRSYLQSFWRGIQPVMFNGQWICGDSLTSGLTVIDGNTRNELGNPLRMRIETGPLNTFPNKIRINSLEMYLTKGVGVATGADPVETDPEIGVSISRDGGQTWSAPRLIKIGRQALTDQRVRASIWGQAQIQGVRWRLEESAGVNFGFMGADMLADTLR